jgi:tetratricopeptide (TPR) repeat protein
MIYFINILKSSAIVVIVLLSANGYSQSSKIFYDNGHKQYIIGNIDSAIILLNSAINLNSTYSDAYHLRAECKKYCQDYNGAIFDYLQSIQYYPQDRIIFDYLSAIRGIAECRFELEDYSSAIRDLSAVISLSYSDSLSGTINELATNQSALTFDYDKRAEAKIKIGDFSGAVADYNRLYQLFPDNRTWVLTRRANAKYRLGDFKGAIDDCIEHINSSESASSEIYFLLGSAKHKIGGRVNLFEAVSHFTNAIVLGNRSKYRLGEFYYARGLVQMELGKKDIGCADFITAGVIGFSGAYEALKNYCKQN